MMDALLKADPAAFEIVKNSLYKIAEEMRVVLAKTAYSPILKSAGDYSCGVFDAKGWMVAQGPDLPIHLGSMPDAVRAVVAAFGADVHDGRRVHPQRSLLRRQPPARRQRRAPRIPPGAACSATPACAPTGPTSARPRPAATAPSPRSTARGCACRRCGSSAAERSTSTSRR